MMSMNFWWIRHFCAAAGLVLALPSSAEMVAMSSGDLSTVTGREGIAFEWDLAINAEEDGSPLPGLTDNEKRFAMKFANRNDGGGEWIVLKGISGRLFFPRFTLDAGYFPAASSGQGDTSRFGGAPVYGQNHLRVTFPEDIEIYDFVIEGVAVEYGATGFLNNANGSFLGLAIDNVVPDQPGTITAEGTMTIYGF